MLKLQDGEVGCKRSLVSLLSYNTETHIGFLNHSDVIPTVSNTRHTLACHLLQRSSNQSFLSGTASTAADRVSLLCDHEEALEKVGVVLEHMKRHAVHNQHLVVELVVELRNLVLHVSDGSEIAHLENSLLLRFEAS